MASDSDDPSSSSTMEEITLTPTPLPTLTVDLLVEILCRLPVKLLLQLRCVCKSWNHIISHPKFAKKHLSTTRHLHLVSHSYISGKRTLASYPLDSIFTGITTNVTKFVEYNQKYPRSELDYIVGSCHGIVCFVEYSKNVVLLWNPSIRKFKRLPPFEMPQVVTFFMFRMIYAFGYDHVTDDYKVIVALNYEDNSVHPGVRKTELKVYTLGTHCWKSVQEKFPCDVKLRFFDVFESGKFVSGKINWLACKDWIREKKYSIVSFDLGNESYQSVLLPNIGEIHDRHKVVLGVLRDCLCLIVRHDVWIMKEYGNKESWTKLFTTSYLRDPNKAYSLTKAVYIYEDDKVLLQTYGDWNSKLIVYDYRKSAFKFTKIASSPEVCVESLISPCS